MRQTDQVPDKGETAQTGRRNDGEQSSSTTRERRVEALHRTAGNQAVQRLSEDDSVAVDMCPRCIRRYRANKPLDCEDCERALRRSRTGGTRSSGGETAVQPKLSVGDPNDRVEREAEQVAKQVMRTTSIPPTGDAVNGIRRQKSDESTTVSDATEEQIRTLRGGGEQLSESTRSFFEPRFGQDFGDVRVHTGPRAHEAARSIDAEAFTVGTDIVFAKGRYRPDTEAGKELIAHELTHVVQQRGSRAETRSDVQRQDAGGGQQQQQKQQQQQHQQQQSESDSEGGETKFSGCDSSEQSHIESSHATAVTMTDRAAKLFEKWAKVGREADTLEELGQAIDNASRELGQPMRKFFGLPIPEPDGSIPDDNYDVDRNVAAIAGGLGIIEKNYRDAYAGLTSATLTYTCHTGLMGWLSCSGETKAYVYPDERPPTIHLCSDANWSNQVQFAQTIVHEATHIWSDTDDHELGTYSLTNAYSYGASADFWN